MKLTNEDKQKLLKTAQECGCPCHEEHALLHCVPCCDAVYELIKDLEKDD